MATIASRARRLLLAALLPTAAAVADDDARWIEHYMDAQAARLTVDAGPAVAFERLATHRGDLVRVRLVDGRVREGRVAKVEHDALQLAMRVSGGDFMFRVARADIARIELGVVR